MARASLGLCLARFNGSDKRSGHLFQNRYKSIICQEGELLAEELRTVISISIPSGHASPPTWRGSVRIVGQDIPCYSDGASVNGRISTTPSSFSAMPIILEFVKKGFDQGRRNNLVEGVWYEAMEDGPRSRDRPTS